MYQSEPVARRKRLPGLRICFTAAIIGLMLLAVATQGLWLAAKDEAKSDVAPELALLPADALGFVHFRVSDHWKYYDAIVKTMAESQRANSKREFVNDTALPEKEFEKAMGFPMRQIERVTAILLAPTGNDQEPPGVAMLTLSQPLPREKMVEALTGKSREEKYKGKGFYVITQLGPVTLMMHFVNERTVLFGFRQSFERLVDALAEEKKLPDIFVTAIEKIKEKHHMVAAGHLPESVAQMLRQEQLPKEMQFLKPLLDVQSAILTANIGEDSTVKITLSCPDKEKARKVKDVLKLGHTLVYQLSAAAFAEIEKQQESAAVKKLMQQVQAAFKAMTFEQQDTQVVVAVQLKTELATVQKALADGFSLTITASDRVRSANNMKQIAIAMHNYHGSYGSFPPAAIYNKDGKALLSWRVKILPYIEADALYKEFKLNEPWDSPHNKKLLEKMPATYAPLGVKTKEPYTTFYQVFTGEGTIFDGEEGVRLQEIRDGTSATVFLVEAGDPVPWTKPDDVAYEANKPLPKLGGLFKEGFNAAFCDGSVRFIGSKFDERTMRLLITCDDKQVVDFNKLNQ